MIIMMKNDDDHGPHGIQETMWPLPSDVGSFDSEDDSKAPMMSQVCHDRHCYGFLHGRGAWVASGSDLHVPDLAPSKRDAPASERISHPHDPRLFDRFSLLGVSTKDYGPVLVSGSAPHVPDSVESNRDAPASVRKDQYHDTYDYYGSKAGEPHMDSDIGGRSWHLPVPSTHIAGSPPRSVDSFWPSKPTCRRPPGGTAPRAPTTPPHPLRMVRMKCWIITCLELELGTLVNSQPPRVTGWVPLALRPLRRLLHLCAPGVPAPRTWLAGLALLRACHGMRTRLFPRAPGSLLRAGSRSSAFSVEGRCTRALRSADGSTAVRSARRQEAAHTACIAATPLRIALSLRRHLVPTTSNHLSSALLTACVVDLFMMGSVWCSGQPRVLEWHFTDSYIFIMNFIFITAGLAVPTRMWIWIWTLGDSTMRGLP